MNKVLKILKELRGVAATSAELLEIFIVDRGTHYRRLRGIEFPRRKKRTDWNPEYEIRKREEEERHRFYALLTKLQKQGFIQKEEKKRLGKWNITAKGIKRIGELIAQIRRALPPKKKYAPQDANEWKIISFDIPERERRKRRWLRFVLKHLKFKQLQKSVWIGKTALPKDFLEDLHNLHMLNYIEILTITKSGSIKQIEETDTGR